MVPSSGAQSRGQAPPNVHKSEMTNREGKINTFVINLLDVFPLLHRASNIYLYLNNLSFSLCHSKTDSLEGDWSTKKEEEAGKLCFAFYNFIIFLM